MKHHYIPASFKFVELEGVDTLLIGSLTTTSITIPKENVTVTDFKNDQTFTENNFGDISF